MGLDIAPFLNPSEPRKFLSYNNAQGKPYLLVEVLDVVRNLTVDAALGTWQQFAGGAVRIPVLLVSCCLIEEHVREGGDCSFLSTWGDGHTVYKYEGSTPVVLVLAEMLWRNQHILDASFKASLSLPKGFFASLVTPIARPPVDQRVHEICALPGCDAYVAWRCSRCYLARCGEAHQAQHWSEACRPYLTRPFIKFRNTLSCASAKAFDFTTGSLGPQAAVPGVVIAKVHLSANGRDANSAQFKTLFYSRDGRVCFQLEDDNAANHSNAYMEFVAFVTMNGKTVGAGEGCVIVYCDVDVLVSGKVLVFTDKTYECFWRAQSMCQ